MLLMIIYNTTTKVAHHFVADWQEWMLHTFLPKILETGLFQSCQMHRLLDQEDDEGETFVAQCQANTRSDYDLFLAHHATALRKEVHEKFGTHVISFHTLMEVID